jgi:hypothetical protein
MTIGDFKNIPDLEINVILLSKSSTLLKYYKSMFEQIKINGYKITYYTVKNIKYKKCKDDITIELSYFTNLYYYSGTNFKISLLKNPSNSDDEMVIDNVDLAALFLRLMLDS